MNCRFCNTPLVKEFIDLVNSPASNSFITKSQLDEPETFYPLRVFVCECCFLVQIEEYKKSDAIFNSDYVYFSSFSQSWLKHSEAYVNMMVNRFGLNIDSKIIEIASNDGYLLQYFVKKKIPVLGIEPTTNTAEVAKNKGIRTITEFFSVKLATQLAKNNEHADVILGNNVLAHVPDIIDFVKGTKILLKVTGVITMEFPHLMQLIGNNQFDTIYHEHFSYLSLYTVNQIFNAQELVIFDVEEISTHGGSLRIYAKHKSDVTKIISSNVSSVMNKEIKAGINNIDYYDGFQNKAKKVKIDILEFLLKQSKENKNVAAYGAAAKGNTLLNYCGIKHDMIKFVVDANPAKQNKYLPGSHIPVVGEEEIIKQKPAYIIIFPWNIKEEVMEQLAYIRKWDGKFVIPIPHLQIL